MDEISFESRQIHVTGLRIAAMKGEIEVGHTYVYCLKNDSRDAPFAFGEDLYVAESVRRQGVARLLAVESIEVVKALGCYKYLGFSRFGREDQHRRLESYGLEKWGYEFRLDLD
ncbi:GNAT family N-acetyltransferase [Streptomyces sp. N50]|uniref:GNAT family N-acetyltransferase n=1 Tax=Streptomyces sp. N50 TaxID=3081765 RepID=UPI00296221CB|nr:GNAT family N-acetyltransferase [Streptomyces sp. N50]WOX10289.1 GNAT family N-acetyltransferase [Streptomyces sp. N50]